MKATVAQLMGRGLAFPPAVEQDGRLQWSEGSDNVRESIRIILLTEPGERLLRRDFGAGLRRLLFEPNTPATRRLIKERIEKALTRWEPRIRLELVTVEETDDPRRVAALVRYALVATGRAEQVTLDINLDG